MIILAKNKNTVIFRKLISINKVEEKMDKNIKLTERYKDIKLLYQIELEKESNKFFTGLFNLKILKKKNNGNTFVLGLQTSTPDYMPNYLINAHTFMSTLYNQMEDTPIIGFYQLVTATEMFIGDFLHVSFDDDKRFEEAPFQIYEMNDEVVKLRTLLDKTDYYEITFEKEVFNRMLKSRQYMKYDRVPDHWFKDVLEDWIDEFNMKD